MTAFPTREDVRLHVRLCAALSVKDLAEAQKALDAGADPNWHNANTGRPTPMQLAAAHGFIAGMEVLLAAGGNVDLRGWYRATPLMAAAERGQVEAGRWLRRHGADDRLVNDDGNSVMAVALLSKHLDFADMLLLERSHDQKRVLTEAARQVISGMDINVAQWLLNKGASPDTVSVTGNPWLVCAVTGRSDTRLPLIKMLIGSGANVNIQSSSGLTPLHRALDTRFSRGFALLLHAGANPDIEDEFGQAVRELVKNLDVDAEMACAFRAWESSVKAQRAIAMASVPDLKSL